MDALVGLDEVCELVLSYDAHVLVRLYRGEFDGFGRACRIGFYTADTLTRTNESEGGVS